MIAQAGELVFAKDDKIRIPPSEFTPNLDHPAFDAVGTPLWTTAEKFDAYGDSVAQGYVRLDYLSTGPPPHSTALTTNLAKGVATFTNITFDEASTRKVLVAHAGPLGNATSSPFRVLPAAAASMVFRPPLRKMYARSPKPPTPYRGDAAAIDVEAINVTVAFLDRLGDDACTA